jgi:hypothetical protein
MRTIRLRRPSPALVVACIALLVALGGTGYATVLQVPRNSVGTLQLQRNAVKAAKVAPNAIRTGHVLNGVLLAEDFKSGQLPAGPRGEKGDKGDRGERGADATTSIVIVRVEGNAALPGQVSQATATCPSGQRLIGGGTENISVSALKKPILNSFPTGPVGGAPVGWFSQVLNDDTIGSTVAIARALCASP